MRKAISLIVAIAIPLVVGGIGGFVTAGSLDTWYPTLAKPTWNPPNWLFGPVWTALYVTMGVAAWLVWREGAGGQRVRTALVLFGVQLALNLGWSLVFFGLQRVGWALVEIVVLWGFLLATLLAFHRVRPLAGWLLAPYQLWVTFAAGLNAAIWALNR